MTAANVERGIETRDRIARRAAKKESVKIIQRLLLQHALRDDDHTATTNDIRAEAELLCEVAYVELDPHDYGSAVTSLRCMGLIESMGYADHSISPRANGNRVRRWRVTDANRAAQLIEQLQESSCHTR